MLRTTRPKNLESDGDLFRKRRCTEICQKYVLHPPAGLNIQYRTAQTYRLYNGEYFVNIKCKY